MVIKWEWLLELTGRGPTRSACMWVNLRAGTGIFWTGADGWVVIFAFWQVLHSAPPANISGHTSPYETGCNQASGGPDTWMYQGVNGGGGLGDGEKKMGKGEGEKKRGRGRRGGGKRMREGENIMGVDEWRGRREWGRGGGSV